MNTSIIKADIFFFISSVAVVLVSICFIIISIYLVRILKDLKILSQKAKDEGEQILDDIKIIRQDVENKGVKVGQFFSFLLNFLSPVKKSSKKRGVKDEKEL